MKPHEDRDFATVLDELLAEAGTEEDERARPGVRLDYLSVADELHSGRIVISRDEAAAKYMDGAGEHTKPVVDAPPLAPDHPDTLPTDPLSIARELGLDKGRPAADLNMLRRRFAVANHPDRVAQHLRDDAMKRMQIANMLIDEAKKKQAAVRGFFKR